MIFRLVHAGWEKELDDALRADGSSVRVVCPFIQRRSAARLLEHGRPRTLQVITRFNLGDFCDGVNDLAALRLLLESGAEIRGVRNLHAKLYLIGANRVIVTSANLTEGALLRNHEFGFVAEDAVIADRCREYFDGLWGRAGEDLAPERLAGWESKVTTCLAGGARWSRRAGLGDEGLDLGMPPSPVGVPPAPVGLPAWVGDAPQAFVKFFGYSRERAKRSLPVLEEAKRSGCHWACTYPKGRRPRQAQDGAVMFMGILAKQPDDILIHGRAVGMCHEPGRDDAGAEDLAIRPWKVRWPHYVRVHHAEFVAGTLANGVSLAELMNVLGSDAFAVTQRSRNQRTFGNQLQ